MEIACLQQIGSGGIYGTFRGVGMFRPQVLVILKGFAKFSIIG